MQHDFFHLTIDVRGHMGEWIRPPPLTFALEICFGDPEALSEFQVKLPLYLVMI